MKKVVTGLWAMALGMCAAMPASAEDAQGHWSGKIAGQLTVVLQVKKQADGKWEAVFSSPSQSFATQVEQFSSDGTQLSFAIARLGASYQANWSEEAKAWRGTWVQGQQAPLSLQRVDAAAIKKLQPRRPQEEAIAVGSAPYDAQDVQFANAGAGVQLAGSLFTPKGAGPWPAVVLVHGSGPNNRNQDIFGHKTLLVLADHLARQGIAVLRYDKRGVGRSSGSYKAATTMDFADDAQAAVAYLRTRPEVDAGHIGVVGHSEGGLIAPIVAARDPQLGFVVMMAGPGVRGELLMLEQLAKNAALTGATAQAVAQQRAVHRDMLAAIVAAPDAEQAKTRATALLQQGERDGVFPPGSGEAMAKTFTTPWFLAFLKLEPATALRAMRQPVLVLNGELDSQVPAKLDLDAIRAALAGNPHAVIKELPRLNHLFQTANSGAVQEYSEIEETIAPVALTEVSDWIRARTR